MYGIHELDYGPAGFQRSLTQSHKSYDDERVAHAVCLVR